MEFLMGNLTAGIVAASCALSSRLEYFSWGWTEASVFSTLSAV